MAAAPALSQSAEPVAQPDAEETTVDEIIVTGFRASLASALGAKRESNLIIESITAEDIGKFPDQNIAESLQRLPGIQIDRENGQGTRVRIRGLDQNVTLLNGDIFVSGLEIFRLGEGNIRQDSSLEGIPSELIGGVDVYKSPDASLLEGGLGGIIDLQTRGARSIRGDTLIAGDVRGTINGDDGDWNPTGSLVVGRRFSDRFALLGTVSYDRSDIFTEALGGDNRGGWAFLNRPVAGGGTRNVWSPEYRYATIRDQERERIGFSLNADLQVSDSLDITADWFHSELSILTSEASIKFPFANENATYSAVDLTIGDNDVLESGTITANSAEAISFVQNAEATTDNFQIAADWDNGGALRGSVRAAYSQGEYESVSGNADVRYTQYTVRNGTAAGFVPNATAPATFTFGYRNGDNPTFTPADPSQFTTPSSVFAKSHWVFAENTEIENMSVRADFEYTPAFADNLTISFGGRLAERTVDSEFGRYLADYSGRGELNAYELGLGDWTPFGYFQDGAIGFKSCDLPVGTPGRPVCSPGGRFGDSPALITPYQTAATTPGRFETVTIGGIAALVQNRGQMSDPVAWISALYPDTPFSFFRDPVESFEVEERTSSGYVMFDVDGERFHINAGARVIHTELGIDSSETPASGAYYFGTDSWNGVLANPVAVTTRREYTDVLPSASAVLDVNDTDKLRVSAARVVSRQNLFQLGQGANLSFTRSTTPGPDLDRFIYTSGSGGNTELDPYRASQFDIAYERYFGRQGLLSAAFFYKSVDSFIQTDTVSRRVADGSVAGSTVGVFTQPVNGEGGSIRGVELAAQYAFDNGFGFNANYTYSDSESSNFSDYEDNLPIPGVAENAFNIQGYYEGYGFEARLSYAWRDKSYQGNFAFGSGADARNLSTWERAYGQLDGQIGYAVSDSVKIVLEGINLTEEASGRYLQFENLPFRYATGERRVSIGARFTLGR
jgi:TonB-dependent receptor